MKRCVIVLIPVTEHVLQELLHLPSEVSSDLCVVMFAQEVFEFNKYIFVFTRIKPGLFLAI